MRKSFSYFQTCRELFRFVLILKKTFENGQDLTSVGKTSFDSTVCVGYLSKSPKLKLLREVVSKVLRQNLNK